MLKLIFSKRNKHTMQTVKEGNGNNKQTINMTKEEIREGNISIASFLGEVREVWKFNKQSTLGWFGETALKYRRELMRMDIGEAILIEHLQFHSSFDWLMPVVEKIAKLKLKYLNDEEEYNPYPTTFSMPDKEGNLMVRLHAHQLFTAPTLLEATWLAVVDFIQWYNTQQQLKQTL
jgi:hypothetical protein